MFSPVNFFQKNTLLKKLINKIFYRTFAIKKNPSVFNKVKLAVNRSKNAKWRGKQYHQCSTK